jgi:hypothetical protein
MDTDYEAVKSRQDKTDWKDLDQRKTCLKVINSAPNYRNYVDPYTI